MSWPKNLRVTNMVVSGKMPFRVTDFRKLILHSRMRWDCINEDMSPIYQTRLTLSCCVSVWPSGAINIVGVTSARQAEDAYRKVVGELKRLKINGGKS